MSSPDSRKQSTSSALDPTAFLRSASFSYGNGSRSTNEQQPVTASSLLQGNFDPLKLHPLAELKGDLEFLDLEDDQVNTLPGAQTVLPSRGWSDDLCYGTGTTYLSGELPSIAVHIGRLM